MRKLARKKISNISFLIVLVYFSSISILVDFLHKPNEDPTKYHEDCPACIWARQLQDTNQTTSATQVCEQMHKTFVRFILIQEEDSNFQSIILANPLSRAPPVA